MSDKDRMDVSTPPPGRRLTGPQAEFAPGAGPLGSLASFRPSTPQGRWSREEAVAIANAITAELVVGSAMMAVESQAAGEPAALKRSAACFSNALVDLIRFGLPGMQA